MHPELVFVTSAQGLADLGIDPVRDQSVYVIISQILVVGEVDGKWAEKERHEILVEIDPLITTSEADLKIACNRRFNKTAHTVILVVVQNPGAATLVVVTSEDCIAFSADSNRRIHDEGSGAANHLGISIQVIEVRIGRDKVVVVVSDLEQKLVQVPQDRNAGGIFESAIVHDVAQRTFLDRILLQLHLVVKIDPEISDENIECDLRFRSDQKVIGIGTRVIEIERITDAQVETQGVELGDRPEHVEGQAR